MFHSVSGLDILFDDRLAAKKISWFPLERADTLGSYSILRVSLFWCRMLVHYDLASNVTFSVGAPVDSPTFAGAAGSAV